MNINQRIIDELYRRFPRRPATLDERNLRLLADFIVDSRGIELDDDRLVFNGMESDSPFREIPLDNIHAVADLGAVLAIVMHSSIIFFDPSTLGASVHIKELPGGLRGYLRALFHR